MLHWGGEGLRRDQPWLVGTRWDLHRQGGGHSGTSAAPGWDHWGHTMGPVGGHDGTYTA